MSGIDDMLNDFEINRRHCNTPVVAWVGWITFLVDIPYPKTKVQEFMRTVMCQAYLEKN